MLEYPKMLYQKGEEMVWEGRNLATKIVADAEAEAKAVEGGWRSIEMLVSAEAAKIKKAVR